MTRACSRSSLPRQYVWRLTGFSLQIWSSAWPLDRPDEIAALTAPLSFVTPFANAATRLVLARSIQVALPMATMMAGRLTNRYDLMDSAYDAPEIAAKSGALGHVPIVDPNPRRDSKKPKRAPSGMPATFSLKTSASTSVAPPSASMGLSKTATAADSCVFAVTTRCSGT
jgi:hypothetical protein